MIVGAQQVYRAAGLSEISLKGLPALLQREFLPPLMMSTAWVTLPIIKNQLGMGLLRADF